MKRNWKLEASTTSASQSPPTASLSGTPMLPTAAARSPEAWSMANAI